MTIPKVRAAIRAKFDQAGSYPLQTVGSVAVGGSALPVMRGQHEVHLGGETGIVATQFGLHNAGVTVGRLATGVYGVAFPNMANVRISPYVSLPTGFSCEAEVGGMTGAGRVVGVSGFAELRLTRPLGATGAHQPCHPATGTVVVLDFEFSAQPQNGAGNVLVPY